MTQLHQNPGNLPPQAKGTVLTIGNFDGLHPGHLALVTKAQEIAKGLKAEAGVMTFEPHPRSFFDPQGAPFRLTLLPAKRRILSGLGVAHLFALRFDAAFAAMSADEFIALLKDKLAAMHIVVGEDFAFGKKRQGTIDTLRRSFDVSVVPPVLCPDGGVYSSTRIRGLLQEGKLEEAAGLMSRPFEIEAEVVHGDKRGRELGFPTANQKIGEHLRLPFGIYAVEALVGDEGTWRRGAASFGIRPMFRVEQPVFETFIFDFDKDIYGKNMRVRPLKFLRPEKSFPGLEALKAQMKQDCLDARAVVKSAALQE